ncbi:Putative membrane-associated trancriptional regulator [Halorhabdus sp. SVX81]|uniref:vWA domain-containing protein n=1 Tax=Halorhabdus sp. SVX81 TaxID=2978283 RepID=UPI0023DB649B|nr:VWA domain-containing protein [Halorhabdus sp. SVX81]WEL16430.1 Putative membrane-associated trancriptional regulator [Halorhabdus sp. SVX81]
MSASGGWRKLFAVVASFLMIVSMVPAGTVSAGTVTEAAGNTAPADTVPDVSMDGPPVVLKAQAMERIENLSAPSNQLESAKERARSRLNDSFAYYQDSIRVGGQRAFNHDTKALRALADFSGTDQDDRLSQIVELVARADNQSARQVIRDAEYAFAATKDNLGPGAKNSAEAHIDNARRQLAMAEQMRESAQAWVGAHSIRTTAQAVRTYGLAFNKAQKALDRIDREIGPEVTLTRRTDPIHNESDRTQYTLVGNVTNPTGLDAVNVTATINDDRTVELPLRPGYANATFAKTINLTKRVNTIEIAAVESEDSTDSKNGNSKKKAKQKDKKKGKNKGNNGNGGGSSGQSQATTVVLRLDGDGLPDTYEENVTGTNPLDPDSNSTIVSGNQGGDGIIDSQHDFDADSVDNRLEYWFGSDPLSSDTDRDGLEDGFEIRYAETSPVQSDTDDNGVVDAEEDPDNDNLTNIREQELGTDPQSPDTDSDQLTDSREQEIGTNATEADTDADGLEDNVEIEFGTDPLDPDTDDDGILDGNETYTTTANNESLGVSADVTATGSVGKTVTIEENTEQRFHTEFADNLTAAPVVNLETDGSIENATVSISYDESTLSVNESELVGVRYNESIQGFEPLPTTIDEANDTVRARTDHFSTFTVFKVPNWKKTLTAQEPPDGGEDDSEMAEIDVMLVIDSSGSMSWNDPNEFRKAAAKEFVGALIEGDRAGVVDFDHNAEVAQELTTDFGSVNVTIESLDSSGGTNIGAGLQRANSHFASNSDDSRAQYTVLLTDGQGGGGISEANTAADRGTTIYTIGFGDANEDKLQQIADITSGGYSSVDDASDLPDVFSRVADDIGPTHSDDDGFSDSLEDFGIPISAYMARQLDNGVIASPNTPGSELTIAVYTDPESNDTDGDGLRDDEEIGEKINGTIELRGQEFQREYYLVNSDPTDSNSDDTGLNDSEEVEVGSDPMEEETLAAGYTLPVITQKSTPENQPATVEQLLDSDTGWVKNPNFGDSMLDDRVLIPTQKEELNGDVQEIEFTVVVSFNPNDAAIDSLHENDVESQFEILDRLPAENYPVNTNQEILDGPQNITLQPGETRKLHYRIGAVPTAGYGFKNLINLKRFKFEVTGLDKTPFSREEDGPSGSFSSTDGYAYPGAPVLESTQVMLNNVNKILSTGFSVAGSTSTGMMIVRTAQGSLEMGIYKVSDGELQPNFPTTSGTPATIPITQGISGFSEYIEYRTEMDDVKGTFGGIITYREN